MIYYLYIIESQKDKTLYTGIAKDVQKRLNEHNSGKGAKYTKGRGPFVLLLQITCENKSSALKLEIKIKKLNKKQKHNFILENLK